MMECVLVFTSLNGVVLCGAAKSERKDELKMGHMGACAINGDYNSRVSSGCSAPILTNRWL